MPKVHVIMEKITTLVADEFPYELLEHDIALILLGVLYEKQ